jgi:hypothetical protein
MAKTLSFSESSKGWVSFHSYEPEWMDRLGNTFFSFKNGNLYKHDDSGFRAQFYGNNYSQHVTYMSNEAPSDVKLFKNIRLESNYGGWTATLTSELESGQIGSTKWENEEGMKYAYIRRTSGDSLNFNELSVLGIGELESVVAANQYNFNFDIPNQVGANNADNTGGDDLYFLDGSLVKLIGTIDTYDGTQINTIATTNLPEAGDFCFVVKDAVAESYGLRGYYAKIKLSSGSNNFVELFAANSEVFKSYM